MGRSPLRGHACILPLFDQDVLLEVMLDVLGLDAEVVVVTACAEDLLDVQHHDVCSMYNFLLSFFFCLLLKSCFICLLIFCCTRSRCSLVYSPF